MEKNIKKAFRRTLMAFATLGSLFAASGCTSTVRVADNFKAPAPSQAVSNVYSLNIAPIAPVVTTPVVSAPVVTAPVIAAPAYGPVFMGPMPGGWCGPRGPRGPRGGHYGPGGMGPGGGSGSWRGGPNINPTAGTHLGNTVDGLTGYYREYQR